MRCICSIRLNGIITYDTICQMTVNYFLILKQTSNENK